MDEKMETIFHIEDDLRIITGSIPPFPANNQWGEQDLAREIPKCFHGPLVGRKKLDEA